MLSRADLFKGRHFDRDIIVVCVRWYLWFELSFGDLVEMMGLAHTTIVRWIGRYVPEFEKRKRRNRFARPVGGSWRVDETYMKDQRRPEIFVSGRR